MTRVASGEPQSTDERVDRGELFLSTLEPAHTRLAERPTESRPNRSLVPSFPYVAVFVLVVALAAVLWWTA